MRNGGWTVAIVEKMNPVTKLKNDLFGFADILAMREGDTPLLIQTTTAQHMLERAQKIKDEPRAALAVRAGFAIEVHGWRKPDGEPWECLCLPLTKGDLPCHSEPSGAHSSSPG